MKSGLFASIPNLLFWMAKVESPAKRGDEMVGFRG
jgi:hypothetical protein